MWLTLLKFAAPVAVAGALVVWGMHIGSTSMEAKYAEQRVAASEQRRNQERLDAVVDQRNNDALLTALVDGADLAHDSDLRMRALSAKYRKDIASASVCRDDAPPGARLSDETRGNLVAEAKRANSIVAKLTACQARETLRQVK